MRVDLSAGSLRKKGEPLTSQVKYGRRAPEANPTVGEEAEKEEEEESFFSLFILILSS